MKGNIRPVSVHPVVLEIRGAIKGRLRDPLLSGREERLAPREGGFEASPRCPPFRPGPGEEVADVNPIARVRPRISFLLFL